MFDLAGQKVLVIGGSSGMGLATAELAAKSGAEVTIASRSLAKLDAAAKTIDVEVNRRVIDVTDFNNVEAFFSGSTLWDHVIVTGSDVTIAAVRELPIEAARASYDSKFWGFYFVAKAARIKPGGSLSVLAGYLASRPVAGRALMGAINSALESLVRGLALELKPIRVNAVSPGVVDTAMWHGIPEESRKAMFEKLCASYPAGCVGQPRDIARQLLLLAATPYATGVVVTLDGGASLI